MPTHSTQFKVQRADFINLKEAGAILGFNPHSVRRLISQGRLRGYRIGNKAIRVRRSDVMALIEPVN